MATYECVNDYGQQPGTDFITQSAQWVIAVFRFRYPATYSRISQGSFTTNYPPALEIRGKPLVIIGDCLQMQVQTTKSTYTTQMSAALAPGLNYESEIFPGDWVMAWMFTNDVDFQNLTTRLQGVTSQGGVPLNGFRDGLKFVGRANAIRKTLDQAQSGHRQVRYSLSCVGFQEMDAQIFYDPLLADNVKALGLLFGRLDADINKLITDKQTGIDVNKALPYIINLMLGRGIPKGEKHGGTLGQRATVGLETHPADDSNPDATFAYGIPTVVAQCLGVQSAGSRGIVAFADILETTVGIQKYSSQSSNAQNSGPLPTTQGSGNQDKAIAAAFMPSNLQQVGNRRQTSNPLIGAILPQIPQFTNNPVWSILNQYLNPAVNEMFMTLRVNQDGNVMPTFTARQFPFTTEAAALGIGDESGLALVTTRFLELPTWGIDPVLVTHVDIGRSDALRFNFIHVYGNAGSSVYDKQQIVYNPPIRDDIDISRSGLRPYMTTVPCHVSSVINHDAQKWMAILSDFLMGQHMTLTGTLTSSGIQAPVCIGDNLTWDGDVYHIEGVTHSCGIDGAGHKSFTTAFNLTHGMRAVPIPDTFGAPDTGIYAEVLPSDESDLNPGLTVDRGSQPEPDTSKLPGDLQNKQVQP